MTRALPLVSLAISLAAASRTAAGAPVPADLGMAELERLERDFPRRPRAEILDGIDRIPARFPDSPAAARALVWRAQLALGERDLDGARSRFAAALARAPDGPESRLAHRGLGDVALRARRFDEAEREYRRAADGATDPALRAELAGKLRLIAKERTRRAVGWAAAVGLAAAATLLGRRALAARGRARFPTEVAYAAPVFALLVAGGRLGDPRVVPALALCSVGSLGVIALSGIASQGARPAWRERAAQLVALVVAVSAVLYLSAYHGALLDLIGETLSAGPER